MAVRPMSTGCYALIASMRHGKMMVIARTASVIPSMEDVPGKTDVLRSNGLAPSSMEAIATTSLSKPSARKVFRSPHPRAAPTCASAFRTNNKLVIVLAWTTAPSTTATLKEVKHANP